MGIGKDLKDLQDLKNNKDSVLSDASNTDDVDKKIGDIDNKLKNEYLNLMNLKLQSQMCSAKDYYSSLNTDIYQSILINKGFRELYLATKIQDLTLKLVKAKHLDIKLITENKQKALEYIQLITNDKQTIEEKDGFDSASLKIEELAKELNNWGICSPVVKDEGCKMKHGNLKNILKKYKSVNDVDIEDLKSMVTLQMEYSEFINKHPV